MILSPSPVQQFTDNNGAALVGGQLFLYQAGSTTKQAAFTDSSGNTALPNPVVLNSRGEVAPSAVGTSCGLWLDPTLAYKMVLAPANDTDPPTNPFWTIDNVVSPAAAVLAALAAYEATIGGVPIGAQMAWGGAAAPTGWLLCYGQAVSRTTYALLFVVLGGAYGSGDNATTFNVPDKRGRVSAGKDDMGGAAANRLTNGVSGVTGTTLGAVGGDQSTQLHDHGVTDPGHTHVLTDPGHVHLIGVRHSAPSTGSDEVVDNSAGPTDSTKPAFTGITIAPADTGITIANFGSGGSQNVQPTEIDNWIVFTGVP